MQIPQEAVLLKPVAENDFAQKVAGCETSYDILRLARELTKSYGFDYFSIMRLPNSEDRQLSAIAIVSNWPPELISTYDQLGLLKDSPVIERLRQSTQPIVWNLKELNTNRPEGRDNLANELFESFGFERGVYFATHDPSGQRGSVSFAGSRQAPTDAELLELSFVANLLYERCAAIRMPLAEADHNLSARERECLVWTSSGKTSAEIAAILGLSEHTVNHYLSAACQKLGAVNRAHAVAKSIRAGLVD